MKWLIKAVLALCYWAGAGALGWWWMQPGVSPTASAAPANPSLASAQEAGPPRAQGLASIVSAADPLGLRSPAPGTAAATVGGAAADNAAIVWRLAALVVRGTDRYAVITAAGQPPVQLAAGQTLPDGDRITAIHVDRIDLQSLRGRARTLHLIEP